MLKEKYNPKDFEDELYQRWEEKGYYKPSMDKTKENYCIMMPPPNVTGKLHMGHALDGTIQDILIRFKRMQGYNTLWLMRCLFFVFYFCIRNCCMAVRTPVNHSCSFIYITLFI